MLKNLIIMWKLAIRGVFNNWSKNKIIVSIIATSFMLIQILLAISEGFGDQVKEFALDSLVGHMKIMNPNYKVENDINNNFVINQDVLDKITKIPEVRGVTKRIQVPVVIKSEREIRNAVLVGIDTSTEKDFSFIGKSYDYKKFNEVFINNGLLIGSELIDVLQTKKGFKLVLSTQNIDNKLIETAYFVEDNFSSSLPLVEEFYIFSDINNVSDIYGMGDKITEVSILLNEDKNLDEIFLEIQQLLPSYVSLYTWGDLNPFLKDWLDMMIVNMTIFFAIVFFAATIPLANTILISVLERINEFGILQALGVKKLYLFLFILLESFIILFLGIIIGTTLGLFISYILQNTGIDISKFASGAAGLGLGNYIYPKVNIINTIYIFVLMLGLGILASIYPGIRAMLYNPVQSLSKKG